jgi:hypothetical protein
MRAKKSQLFQLGVVVGNVSSLVAVGRADCAVWIASPLQGEGEGEGLLQPNDGWKLKKPSPHSTN